MSVEGEPAQGGNEYDNVTELLRRAEARNKYDGLSTLRRQGLLRDNSSIQAAAAGRRTNHGFRASGNYDAANDRLDDGGGGSAVYVGTSTPLSPYARVGSIKRDASGTYDSVGAAFSDGVSFKRIGKRPLLWQLRERAGREEDFSSERSNRLLQRAAFFTAIARSVQAEGDSAAWRQFAMRAQRQAATAQAVASGMRQVRADLQRQINYPVQLRKASLSQ